MQIVKQLLGFLHHLASAHKDYAVVLCCLNAKEALSKLDGKHSAHALQASELKELLASCEKHAQLHSSLTSNILAGCIQVRRECTVQNQGERGSVFTQAVASPGS